jgi:Polysaccharide lyase family 4, domain II
MAKRMQGKKNSETPYILSNILYSTVRYIASSDITVLLQGYQFWSQADEFGNFYISNVRIGDYNLYAWVPGFIGDYKLETTLNITSGTSLIKQNLTVHIYILGVVLVWLLLI